MSDWPALDRLCDLAGLKTRYVDGTGQQRELDQAGRRKLLGAMGFHVRSESDVADAARSLERRLRGAMLPPVLVFHDDEDAVVGVVLPTGRQGDLAWRIDREDGDAVDGRAAIAALALLEEFRLGEDAYERRALAIGRSVPLGYHRISVRFGEAQSASATLIVAPRRCFWPAAIAGTGRRWGLAVQLYAQRSARNWGMGDFTDLKALLRLAAGRGAAALGLNPLHALFPLQPEAASPYSPNSRLFLNILYLDVEAIADYADSRPARRLVASSEFQERLSALRAAALVDYAAVAACKLEVLGILFRSFRERCVQWLDDSRVKEFRRFQEEGGERLQRFALFQALRAAAVRPASAWRQWPAAWRDPTSPDLAEFARSHAEEIEYQEYLQWQAELQLSDAKLVAERLGMSIGLYHDLAVGAEAGGAEAWDWQDVLVPAVSAGAPPDAWSLGGQNWGLPPFHPLRLREEGYRPFAELLRRNMRRGGAIRIDHMLGFMRLFWIPEGASPAEGSYVAYPLTELLAVLALESQRARCLVVGEDLGTIPDGLREALAQAGVLSYRLLYFERDGAGNLQRPANYPREALVSVSTHDLPNLAAYWTDADVALRDQLGLWPSPQHRAEHVALRQRDRACLLARLREEGLLAPEGAPAEPPIEAIHRLLARTPCRLLMIQLQDVLGQLEQLNVPGTIDQYPNWRLRPTAAIEDLATDERLASLAGQLRPSHGD